MEEIGIVPKLAFEILETAEASYVQHQKFTPEILLQLHSLFGEALTSAAELLENCKIIKYQTSGGVRQVFKIGTKKERFTIYNDINFCQCPTFRLQVLENGNSLTCRHVLAVKLNQISNRCQVVTETVTGSQFVEFLNEQLSCVDD